MALRVLQKSVVITGKFRDIGPPVWLQLQKCCGVRNASAMAEPERKQAISAPRTSVKSPSLHTQDHLGMWYTIEPELVKKLFDNHSMTKKQKKQCETFGETSVMIRRPSLNVIDFIKRSNLQLPPNKFLLYGRHGAGKTISLIHITHFLSEDGWILLHVPWVPNWRRTIKEINPSSTNPGDFDHPMDASAWLTLFKGQNSGRLNELQTSETYTWSRREATEAGSPLMAVVDHGINRVRYATDAVMAVTKELKKHATEGRCKVAVVADGINSFFCPSSFHKVDNVFVNPNRFTLFKAFLHLFNNDWKNGCIVGSVDIRANEDTRRDSHLPRYLLRRVGWEAMDPFVPIPVDDYNDLEMRSIIDYYIDRDWLQSVGDSVDAARLELAAYSNQNPGKLMEVCGPL